MSLMRSTVNAIMHPVGVVKSWLNPTEVGNIPTNWPITWWQEGRSPVHYGMNGCVEACVAALAETTAMTQPQHWKTLPSGGRKQLTTSPLAKLLKNPNNFQTNSDFMLNMVHMLYKSGNAYVFLDDYEGNDPTSMYLLNPHTTRGYRDKQTGDVFYGVSPSEWYEIDTLEDTTLVSSRRIVHIKLYTPSNPLLGVTPIQSVAASIAANNAILGHEAAFFTNMSRPSGVLATDQVLTKDQLTILREAWNAQSTTLNSGGVPILTAGLRWENMSLSSQDSQLIEALKMTVRDISRAFRVPLQIINADEGSTVGNVETLINWWLASGLGFLLDHIESAFSKAFRLPDGEYLSLNTDGLMRSDMKLRISTLGEAVMKGIYSPNEARALEFLPPVEYGDEPRVQQQVVPLSYYSIMLAEKLKILNEPTEPPPAEPDAEDEPDKGEEPKPEPEKMFEVDVDDLFAQLNVYRIEGAAA